MEIREARVSVGLTQRGMSELTGIPIRTIQDWESGRRSPSEWVKSLVVDKLLNSSVKEKGVINMKNFEQVKKIATDVITSIDNNIKISIETDAKSAYYYDQAADEEFLDVLKKAYQDYVNIICMLKTDEKSCNEMISLEIVELDNEDDVIETHYLDTFEMKN